ncbi:MAG TPA: carbamoyltransferase HypF [Solirubrobacteraceae bacterium]|jgi:hydrogenase maturation protein HypF|nr:carbamoyltransferase HypF [Solirubrobacteraceae bacterium]
MTAAAVGGRRRARARVRGTVQGVGFRPYVYRLAGELGLAGFVLNDVHGVVVEVEGEPAAVDAFLARLAPEAPPLAVIERVEAQERAPIGDAGFIIRASPGGGVPDAAVTPDSATCPDCLAELSDPADRRFRYPFINCTNCGPRFTIVRGVPYDRPLTTMAGFAMCPRCRAEYEDPADRRFHAQPNACPVCGPSVALLGAGGRPVETGDDPIAAAVIALNAGAVVAIKGIGGYHLACRADDELAVAALRARKHREDKPFALMVASAAAADPLVALDDEDRALLAGPQRPIVLAPRRPDARLATAVAPGAPELGIMLPYSPLHHLLLADAGTTLVMTSGNVSDEPIAFGDDDALGRLSGIADLFLVHDRPIHTRTDDSVVRTQPRRTMLRRSRGYVPGPLALPAPGASRPLLACGAELKNTFCVAKGERAWVSHHIGDLENYETLRSFTEGIDHFCRLFAVRPEVVVHDLHPEYLSTKYARDREGVQLIGVQHHHAHLAACLAEHGVTGPALGAIFDGTGYGTDGTVWGGELLFGDVRACRRVGMLRPVPLPGGAAAIRQPWRMACAWLTAARRDEGGDAPVVPPALAGVVTPRAWQQVRALAAGGASSPLTSSMGRLFDAVAALCGIRAEVSYEGQAAIELEAACDPQERGAYPFALGEGGGEVLVVDPGAAIREAAADVAAGRPPGVVAARFHRGVAAATTAACIRLAAACGTEIIVLSGGVFQNRRLLGEVSGALAGRGLRVLVPERLPANDGGIAFGQAAVAAATLAARGIG